MSKIVAVLNQKGGSGKTTLATHLARSLVLDGQSVLLVDSDPQGSARDWHAAGDGALLPVVGLDRPSLDKGIKAIAGDHDWVIIDGAPQVQELAVAALKVADAVLIPVQPSPYDVWATSDLVELIKTRQEITDGLPRAAFVIWRQIRRTRISTEVRGALDGYGFPVFDAATSQRVIFAASAAEGSTCLDKEPKGPASDEVRAIVSELKTFVTARMEASA